MGTAADRSGGGTTDVIEPRPKLLTFDCYGTLIDRATGIRDYFGEGPAKKNAGADLKTLYRPRTGS